MSGINELLPEETLLRIRDRAQGYDAKNRFFTEDLEELVATGYLAAGVPTMFGGSGLSLAELTLAQRRLAQHSPPTALGVNMHLLWVAVAKILYDDGDDRLEWVLRDAGAGEIFAFGISEAGNESVLLDSYCEATPEGDDYLLSGKKVFTTLSPAWTRLGVHARVNAAEPKIVAGFLRRDSLENNVARTQDQGGPGISYPDVWNPLGMRATQSWNTQLDGARLLGVDVVATYDPFDPSDPLLLAVSAAFATLTSSVYVGIADRALELATEAANQPVGTGLKLDDPDVAARLTSAVLEHRNSVDILELIASDVDAGVDREDWSSALAALKNRVTDEARVAIDTSIRTVGSRAYAADSELARLYRDVLAGLFHPRSSRSLAASVRASLTIS